MKQYRGYYIDKVIFKNEQDIDAFIKSEAVRSFKRAVILFMNDCSMANSIYCDEQADKLVNKFGFTWDEVDTFEIEALESGTIA